MPHSIKVITGHSKCQNFSSILNGATNMLYIKSLQILVSSRKEAKEKLGGTNAFNKALKIGDIIFY